MTTKEIMDVVLSFVNALAIAVLVGVTLWYAVSSARMVAELRRQIGLLRAQAALQAKAAEISAQTALIQAAGQTAGAHPIPRLRQLAKELRELATQLSQPEPS